MRTQSIDAEAGHPTLVGFGFAPPNTTSNSFFGTNGIRPTRPAVVPVTILLPANASAIAMVAFDRRSDLVDDDVGSHVQQNEIVSGEPILEIRRQPRQYR